MDKYRLIEKCNNTGIDVSKYIQKTNEMAYELVVKLYFSNRFLELRNELLKAPIYYYLLFRNAYLMKDLESVQDMYAGSGHVEVFCKEFLSDVITPIFSFDDNFISSEIQNISQEDIDKFLCFIKNIRQISLQDITLDNILIKNIQELLLDYYKKYPTKNNVKFSEHLLTPSYLEYIKVDKPIKLEESEYDITDLIYDEQKYKLRETQIKEWFAECRKAICLFDILELLVEEDVSKVNDFIMNNMTYVLDSDSKLESSFVECLPNISPILCKQQEKRYIDTSIQKKLVDFYVSNNATDKFYVDYCAELEDYIFENYIGLLENLRSWKLSSIVVRNVNKIDAFKDVEDIKIAMQLFERSLSYENTQYDDELKRCTYNEKIFVKVLNIISRVKSTVPSTRNYIQTCNPEQTIISLYLINCHLKNVKQQSKGLASELDALIKENFEEMFVRIKNKNALEKAYKKIRNQSLEVVYEKEIREMKEMIDSEYKKYVEDFHKSQKYSFEKYYAQVETKLNEEIDFHKYVQNKNFSQIFSKITLTYNAKEIKELLASNEYYYSKMEDNSEGCELTPLMTCLIKAIEQFMCACISYSYIRGWCSTDVIYDKYKHKLNSIDWANTKITCSPLKMFIEDNILNNEINYVNKQLKDDIIKCLENFIANVRNGHFHKHNVFDVDSVEQYVNDAYSSIRSLIAMIIYLEENHSK